MNLQRVWVCSSYTVWETGLRDSTLNIELQFCFVLRANGMDEVGIAKMNELSMETDEIRVGAPRGEDDVVG